MPIFLFKLIFGTPFPDAVPARKVIYSHFPAFCFCVFLLTFFPLNSIFDAIRECEKNIVQEKQTNKKRVRISWTVVGFGHTSITSEYKNHAKNEIILSERFSGENSYLLGELFWLTEI